MGQLTRLFLLTREERNCEPRTVADYAAALRRFLESPDTPDDVRALSGDHLTLFMASLRRAGVGPSGREALQRKILTFMRWLYDRGELERDPRRGVQPIMVPAKIQPQVREDTFMRLLTCATSRPRTSRGNQISAENQLRNVAILRLMWATGLRRSEVTALRLEDVRWDVYDERGRKVPGSELLVAYAKGKKQRRQPFDLAAKRALLEYVVQVRGEEPGPLFLSRSGALTPGAIQLFMKRLARRAGVEAPPHAFRRGFARRMRAGGLDLGETAALMGHSTLVMTRHYSQEGETDAAIAAYRKLTG